MEKREIHVRVAPDGSVSVWCECPHECPDEQDFLVDALTRGEEVRGDALPALPE